MKQKQQRFKNPPERISVTIPSELGERLRDKALRERISISYSVAKAVEKYMEEVKREYKEKT